jgi:hypothetical protein
MCDQNISKHVNAKMIPVETVPRIRGDESKQWRW